VFYWCAQSSDGSVLSFARMNEQKPPTVSTMTAELSATIKAGAVHMFADEADTLARQCVVAIREKWPAIFRRQPKRRKVA